MKDSDWIILDKLYKTPNITKVANMLYISQPSLTKRIKSIEEEFNIKIVDRTSKGVVFTPQGEYLAKKAEIYINFIEEIKNDLKQYDEESKGVITVGSSYTYGKFKLADLFFEYSEKKPGVSFDVVTEQSHNLFRMLVEGDLSLGFISGNYEGPIDKILVKQDKAYIVSKDPINLDELPYLKRIDYRSNDKSKELLDNWWNERYKESKPADTFAGYIDFAWKLIDKGLGYTCCFLPDEFKNDYNLHLTPLLDINGNSVIRNTWFAYSKTKKFNKIEKEFIQFIKDNIAIDQMDNIDSSQ